MSQKTVRANVVPEYKILQFYAVLGCFFVELQVVKYACVCVCPPRLCGLRMETVCLLPSKQRYGLLSASAAPRLRHGSV